MDLNTLKKEAKYLEPVMRIGKNGLNDNVITEVHKLLKKRKLIKIKILNNCSIEHDELIENIISKTNTKLILNMGNNFVIYKESTYTKTKKN